ncbi:conserved hypothetical protein [Truepera radiovictrix DSM 17093]|uniref:Uncharacterized protein n=1 Tax=Truepera radiovictrix (strain DSM 17093 / CIP 108686 / LMG 22925 / RQ-24) TaxID=649638 RepID=D7CQ56_TRURR|nr:conserved hypothetical protein [Truepera radiovictrix DSM 17093]
MGAVLLLLTGCLPIPDLRAPLTLPPTPHLLAPHEVATQYVTVPGFAVPGTPARLNRSFYLRYHTDAPTETVVILVPGLFGGAANLDALARLFVASREGLEVWAVDRRANALEDRTMMLKSLRTGDPSFAHRYYVRDAGTPAGFNPLPPEEVGFMRRWGLEAHLRDLHEMVRRAHEVAETVVLGGHSLGASLVSLYAAFRFEDGVGDAWLDALLLLDGTLGRTGAFGFADAVALGNWELLPSAEGFEAGRGPPYLPFGAGPAYFAKREVAGLLAALEPAALSPGGFYPFAVTNLAAFGLQNDRDFVLSPVFSSSVGEPVGARYGGNLVAFLLDGWRGRRNRTVAGVADGYAYVDWDARGAHTDLHALARSASLPETNVNEWYFPLRLLIDMSALPLDLRGAEGFVPHSEVSVPTLAVGAERGLVSSLDGFSAYGNLRSGALFSSYIVPDYAHLDLINARDNPVVPLLLRWLAQVTQLRRSSGPPPGR